MKKTNNPASEFVVNEVSYKLGYLTFGSQEITYKS